jgi:hypothetical protein
MVNKLISSKYYAICVFNQSMRNECIFGLSEGSSRESFSDNNSFICYSIASELSSHCVETCLARKSFGNNSGDTWLMVASFSLLSESVVFHFPVLLLILFWFCPSSVPWFFDLFYFMSSFPVSSSESFFLILFSFMLMIRRSFLFHWFVSISI